MVKISTFSGTRESITIFTTDRASPRSVYISVSVLVFYAWELITPRWPTVKTVSFVHHIFCETLAWFNSCSAVRVRPKAACSAMDYVGEGYADQTSSLSQLHRYVVGLPGLTGKGEFRQSLRGWARKRLGCGSLMHHVLSQVICAYVCKSVNVRIAFRMWIVCWCCFVMHYCFVQTIVIIALASVRDIRCRHTQMGWYTVVWYLFMSYCCGAMFVTVLKRAMLKFIEYVTVTFLFNDTQVLLLLLLSEMLRCRFRALIIVVFMVVLLWKLASIRWLTCKLNAVY